MKRGFRIRLMLLVIILPILMATFSTIIGLSPRIFETAVGLERLSPLYIVAGSGLLVGTFMTMIVVPVLYSGINSAAQGFFRLLARQKAVLTGE